MSGEDVARTGSYDVGVAIVPMIESIPATPDDDHPATGGSVPGYDDVLGRRQNLERPAAQIERGDAAVRAATEAIAGQIGITAQRIAEAIDQKVAPPSGQSLAIEEVEVTFGISLAAGIQALFTAQAQSSAQVTIRLSRQAASRPGSS
ncbi:MAG TPA: hypothetical protein VGI74_12720 [Streptosporangiaceae bacterium]|jgi:hypothetical protein